MLDGLTDVVLHGCGAQTRIASPSLEPIATVAAAAGASVAASDLSAVVTLLGCHHVQLRSFVVEAGEQEVGILLDRSSQITETFAEFSVVPPDLHVFAASNTDVAIVDTVLTASTLPAVLALNVSVLTVCENRIAMDNVPSAWPAVYVSGAEIRIDGNWVGLRGSPGAIAREPASVQADLGSGVVQIEAEYGAAAGVAPGGIMIAGPSTDVIVTDNEIEGGSRNGITLGNFSVLDSRGTDTGQPTGVVVGVEDPCATTGTLVLPTTPSSGPSGSTIVAGGRLANITLDGNRIRNMGLCGIGPVGFFDLALWAEVITIDTLTVTGNEISNTLLRAVSASEERLTTLGYGAICVPDVRSLVVRDNAITDFGAAPGAAVCGIFVLHAQGVDLSRNRIIQTSELDLSADRQIDTGLRSGILVALVTPPTVGSTASANPDALSRRTLLEAGV